MEEEERLAAVEKVDPQDELKSLQDEGNMPIDQLLALYYGESECNDKNEGKVQVIQEFNCSITKIIYFYRARVST